MRNNSIKAQQGRVLPQKRARDSDDQNNPNVKRLCKYAKLSPSRAFVSQIALDKSPFGNLPHEIRSQIFNLAVTSDKSVDNKDHKAYVDTKNIAGVCKLFHGEARTAFFKRNDLTFNSMLQFKDFIKGNMDSTHLVKNIYIHEPKIFPPNEQWFQKELTTRILDQDFAPSFTNLQEFTLEIEWVKIYRMGNYMPMVYRAVAFLLAFYKINTQRLNIISKAPRVRCWHSPKPPVESITYFGNLQNAMLLMEETPLVLSQEKEILRPGDRLYIIYVQNPVSFYS